jgi:hypothetical protein
MPPPEHEEQREMPEETGRPEEEIDTGQTHRKRLPPKTARSKGAKFNDFKPNGRT